MSNEQIAHDLAIAIIVNRKIETPDEASNTYQKMYTDLLHRLSN